MKEKLSFILVQDENGFWKTIRWAFATEEQRRQWENELNIAHGGDSSGRGDKPGYGKNLRRKNWGGNRFTRRSS